MWTKFKESMKGFMRGRYGSDQFSMALLIFGLIVSIISNWIPVVPVSLALNTIGIAAYIFSLFRVFSRNIQKRYNENQKFLSIWRRIRSGVTQFVVRLKNAKKYKYFKCPECHSRLRLPRKVGEVTVTCGKCHHKFKKKA